MSMKEQQLYRLDLTALELIMVGIAIAVLSNWDETLCPYDTFKAISTKVWMMIRNHPKLEKDRELMKHMEGFKLAEKWVKEEFDG